MYKSKLPVCNDTHVISLLNMHYMYQQRHLSSVFLKWNVKKSNTVRHKVFMRNPL